jgi:hypothetical protein
MALGARPAMNRGISNRLECAGLSTQSPTPGKEDRTMAASRAGCECRLDGRDYKTSPTDSILIRWGSDKG